MKKNLNCGNLVLIKDMPEFFEGYENGMINCGNMLITTKAHAELNRRNISVNCGNQTILDIKGKIVKLLGTLGKSGDYTGCFLVNEGNLVLSLEDEKKLTDIDGMYIGGTLFVPESFDGALLKNVHGRMKTYPDGATVVTGDLALTANAVGSLEGLIYVADTVTALEEDALKRATQKGLVFHAGHLFTYQGLYETYGGITHASDVTCVPDGHAIVDDLDLTAVASHIHGGKLYVKGDLMLLPADRDCIGLFQSIVVQNAARVPLECFKEIAAITKAGNWLPYEGELKRINGNETFSHAMLDAARNASSKYTVEVNGTLCFAEDVTAEDLDCIASLSYNGVVCISDELKPIISKRIIKANGMITNHAQVAKVFGEDAEDADAAANVNMGNLTLI